MRHYIRWGAVLLLLFVDIPALAQDETRIGEHLIVSKGIVVDNAISVGGDVVVYGEVRRDAVSLGGDLVIWGTGRVGRHALAIGGRIITKPGATIGGERLEIHNIPGLSVLGQLGVLTTRLSQVRETITSTLLFLKRIYWVDAVSVALALGLLVQVLLPGQVEATADAVGRYHWIAACVGVVGLLGALALIVMVGISVVGIPLIPVLVMVIVVALLIGYVSVGYFLGQLFPSRAVAGIPMLTIICGVGLLTLASAFPGVGVYIFSVASIVGFGAVLIVRFGLDRRSVSPPE